MPFQPSKITSPASHPRPRTGMSTSQSATGRLARPRRMAGLIIASMVVIRAYYRLNLSLTVMAVYQRFDYHKKNSIWLFIQVPQDITTSFRTRSSSGDKHSSPREVHERIFSVAEQDWRDYICYLDDEVRKLETKASFIDVEHYSEGDYLVAFADSQKLQRLRRKLLKSRQTLDGCLEVATGCQQHWQDLQSRGMSDSGQMMADIGPYVSRIKSGKLGVETIIENVEGVAKLFFHILDYRNQNAMVKSSEALNRNAALMHDIAIATKADNELMTIVAGESQKDSRTIKILTIIALVYLPASLVAEVFNSNLIQIATAGEKVTEDRLVLSQSFWIYPVTTSCLMLFTFLPILLLHSRNNSQNSIRKGPLSISRAVM